MHEALDGQPEDRLLGTDGVATCDHSTGLGHHGGGGSENGADGLDGHALREGGDVEGEGDAGAHGEHVAAGVGRRHGPEVGRVVDQRGEEVGGGDHREVVAHAVDGGVVERSESDEQRLVHRSRQGLDEGVER